MIGQHMAIVRDAAHGLTDIAGGTEDHCERALATWIAEHGLPHGGSAMIVSIVQEQQTHG